MNDTTSLQAIGYDAFYAMFDTPLAQRMRREIYGKDLGQHSWVDSQDLEHDMGRLQLSSASRLLDLGCGPGGLLSFVVGLTGCRGTGLDLSAAAINCAVTRNTSLGLTDCVTLQVADLDEPLPLGRHSFEAVMSLDVILHLRNRSQAFAEVARVLVPGGRFLFTDAAVITGPVSDDEIRLRSVHGYTQFVPPMFNEQTLEQAGLRVLATIDRTASLRAIAARRQATRLAHRIELERIEGPEAFDRHQRYLDCVYALARRGAMARMMYVAESLGTPQ
jgi:cyclopropane fatty-acyl-phospholipid synthase-like methyltransferase